MLHHPTEAEAWRAPICQGSEIVAPAPRSRVLPRLMRPTSEVPMSNIEKHMVPIQLVAAIGYAVARILFS